MADTEIAQLEKFALPSLQFQRGPGELITAVIDNAACRAEIVLQGAHVLSFTPRNEAPVLWHSSQSYFAPGKPIRGGIPVCWPWFGAHPDGTPHPAHGYARLSPWRVLGSCELPDGATRIELELATPDDHPEKLPLGCRCAITAGRTLRLELTSVNHGSQPYRLSEALHSYFAVSDVTKIRITGLEDTEYADKVGGGYHRQPGAITIGEEVDRIYLDTPAAVEIHDPGLKRTIVVSKSGSESTVVWNPWIAKAQRMPDYGDAEYPEMVCVETVNADRDSRLLLPGAQHTLICEIATK